MNSKSILFFSTVIISIVVATTSFTVHNKALTPGNNHWDTDSTSVRKLDSLLLPYVLEGRTSLNIKTKEEAHNVSEQLLIKAAAGLSDQKRPSEDVLASLVASLVSQRIKEEFGLVNDLYYAVLFQDQAIYYSELGFHDRALEKEQRAMSIILSNKKSPDFNSYYPDELERLADRYHNLHNLEEAISFQTKANDFYLTQSLLDYYGCGLFKRARYNFENQDYSQTIDDFNGFIAAMKKANEEIELEDMQELLSDRGASYIHLGDLKNAIKDAEANTTVSKLLFGANSLEYSNSLSNYATVLTFMDEHFKAKELFEKALSILEGKAEWGYDYMITCDQYSITLIELGEYNEAKKYSDCAINYCLLNKIRDYDYAQALINASRCSSYLGDYETSYNLSKEALQVEIELGLPEERKNFGYYAALSSFAESALAIDNIEEAEKACRTIINEGKGKNFSAFIGSYIRLSKIEMNNGNDSIAIEYATQAIETAKAHSLSGLDAIGQLASCFLNTGQYDLASERFSECVSISQKAYGDLNLSTLYFKIYQCYTLFKLGEKELVIKYAKEINENIKQIATNSLLGMTNKEKYFFIERLSLWSENVLPIIAVSLNDDDLLCELYNATLYNKGLLMLQERINNIALHQQGSLYNQLKEYQRQYNNKIEEGDNNSTEARTLLINLERAEKALLSNMQTDVINSLVQIRNNASWDGVRQNLDERDIAIEIVVAKDTSAVHHYYALLLRKNSRHPQMIHLFNENDLPNRPSIRGIRPTKKEMAYFSEYYESLYSLVWQPIDGELKGVKRVFFSPARKLYAVGIEDATHQTKPISEDFTLNRVSSTILLRRDNKARSIAGQALLFGGLNMDMSISNNVRPQQLSSMSTIRLPKFSDISQSTLEEVIIIHKLLDNKRIPSSVYSASDGTELQFKKHAENESVEIIHIATHGIFVDNRSITKQKLNGTVPEDRVLKDFSGYQDAMQHSALAFSGANNSTHYEEDNNGILTAKEISELNIPELELTVLSACQTGLGESSFDGIAGLQRGFKIAGCKTIIMSLWDVDSEVTTELMTLFYKEWLKGKTKEEAFRKAKKKIKSQNSNPYYWASFVMLD